MQVRLLPGPLWKDCHRRGTPSRKRVGREALGVRLPLLPLRSGVVESVRRAAVNREAQVRGLPPELVGGRCPWRHGVLIRRRARFESGTSYSRPRGRIGHDAGPSTRKLRVRVPPRVLIDRLPVGETATPPASGAGNRWFDSSQADLARWRSGCPRGPHEPEIAGSNPARAICPPPMPALPASALRRAWIRGKSSWLRRSRSRTSRG